MRCRVTVEGESGQSRRLIADVSSEVE